MRQIISLVTMAAITTVLGACRVTEANEQAEKQPDHPAAAVNASATDEGPVASAATDPLLQWGPCPEGMPRGCGIAILHGDPAKPNADIFLRVPGGSAIPPHAHTSAERIILVGGELEVKYRGSPAATVQTGGYAYGPANLPHRAHCRSSEPCTLFIAFEQPVDVLPVEGELN